MSTRRKGLLEKLSHFPISSLRYVSLFIKIDTLTVNNFLLVRYIAAHIVGRRLIYPGSLLILNMAVG